LPMLAAASVFRAEALAGIDLLFVRENRGGLYFGEYGESRTAGTRRAFHRFQYDETEVRRILNVGINIARGRRRHMTVIDKPGGIPSISNLWRDIANELCRNSNIDLGFLEVDTANYRVMADPRSLDVVVAPNLFGDVLADGAAALLASRGMSYSANFSDNRVGVYQTAHGAAYDLAGLDRANPLGQIYSLAMLLHESFHIPGIHATIVNAIADVLDAGWRTPDIMQPGGREIGTADMSARVAEAVLLRHAQSRDAGDGQNLLARA